jgi:hypothetical protein
MDTTPVQSVQPVQIRHSWPAWTLGPRAAHPKFGGGVIIGGIPSVDERLRLIKKSFPDDLTSGHLWHEFGATIRGYKHLNNRNSVSFKDLVDGIQFDDYSHIAALTVPAFGIPGVQNGAATSPDPAVREMYFKMHVDSICKTQRLKSEGLGEGIYIWWPAWDSQRKYHGDEETKLSIKQAWNMLVKTWRDITITVLERLEREKITPSLPLVWLEWKPEVPGQDYINTIGRAIRFCQEVNRKVGANVFAINNEWAHLLIGGTTVEDGTRQTIEAGLFTGFFHANSADLAVVKISEKTGEVLRGTPGDDRDWYVGAGGQKRWEDQQQAVALMLKSGKSLIAEHDIDPAGDDPLEYYTRSRNNLENMIQASLAMRQ